MYVSAETTGLGGGGGDGRGEREEGEEIRGAGRKNGRGRQYLGASRVLIIYYEANWCLDVLLPHRHWDDESRRCACPGL